MTWQPPLSRDPKCGVCGHPNHVLICLHDGACSCEHPPVPGIPEPSPEGASSP